MRARISIAMGSYWGSMAFAINVIAMITALGAIGGVPALLSALVEEARLAMSWLQGWQLRASTASAEIHALCNKE